MEKDEEEANILSIGAEDERELTRVLDAMTATPPRPQQPTVATTTTIDLPRPPPPTSRKRKPPPSPASPSQSTRTQRAPPPPFRLSTKLAGLTTLPLPPPPPTSLDALVSAAALATVEPPVPLPNFRVRPEPSLSLDDLGCVGNMEGIYDFPDNDDATTNTTYWTLPLTILESRPFDDRDVQFTSADAEDRNDKDSWVRTYRLPVRIRWPDPALGPDDDDHVFVVDPDRQPMTSAYSVVYWFRTRRGHRAALKVAMYPTSLDDDVRVVRRMALESRRCRRSVLRARYVSPHALWMEAWQMDWSRIIPQLHQEFGKMSLRTAQFFEILTYPVVRGLICLKETGLLYTDMKPHNLLFRCRNGIVETTIGDLGSMYVTGWTSRATSTYPPPGRVGGMYVDPVEADIVWGLGMLFLYLWVGLKGMIDSGYYHSQEGSRVPLISSDEAEDLRPIQRRHERMVRRLTDAVPRWQRLFQLTLAWRRDERGTLADVSDELVRLFRIGGDE